MHKLESFHKNGILFLLLLIIASGLVTSDYFYSVSYTAFYLFMFSSLLFVLLFLITPPHLYITKNQLLVVKPSVLFFGLWSLYVLAQYFNKSASSIFTLYFLVHFLLLLTTTSLFSNSKFKFHSLFYGIVCITTVELLYCLTQYFGMFNPKSQYFTVTGSWRNPNVTAQYLAMTIPAFLFLFRTKFKKLVLGCFIVLLVVLTLLKCRSAFIGATVSVIVFYALELDFANWIKNKKNKSTAKALLILSLLLIIPISLKLYEAKKNSADGRFIIWKIASFMAVEKPLTGYGYGFFEKEYNLFQAHYIQTGNTTPEEQNILGPTLMAHNELIQNTVEGGIIGLVLMILFFGSLLVTIKQKKKPTNSSDTPSNGLFSVGYAGVLGFLAMAMFNFAIQAIPVMTVLTLYAALICSCTAPISKLSTFFNNKLFLRIFTFSIITISLFLLYSLLGRAQADHHNKKAYLLKKENRLHEALAIMPGLEPYLNDDSNYWENYGNIHFLNKNYSATLDCLTKAKETASTPELFLGSGICYQKMNQYPQAIKEFTQLVCLHPSKFRYRYLLMTAYFKNKDTLNSLQIAKGIIGLKPKIPSAEVVRYKKIARNIVRAFDKNAKNKVQITKKMVQGQQQSLILK